MCKYIYIYIYIYVCACSSIAAYANIFRNPKLLLIDFILILKAFCSNPVPMYFLCSIHFCFQFMFSERLQHFQKFNHSSTCLNPTQLQKKSFLYLGKCSFFTNFQIESMIWFPKKRSGLCLLTSFYILLLCIICADNIRFSFILSSPTCCFGRARRTFLIIK